MKEIKVDNPGSSIILTKEQADSIGIDLNADSHRLELTTVGPWGVAWKCKGICITTEFIKSDWGRIEKTSITFHGDRTLTNVRQAGYYLEGYVSIKGKKYSACTHSELIEVDGKLIEVEVLCARTHPFPN